MSERLRNNEALISEREVLEGQSIETLVQMKADALAGISDRERIVHLINDVLSGYGIAGSIAPDPGAAYDANDDTPSYREHLDDSRWAVETIPDNIELGRE